MADARAGEDWDYWAGIVVEGTATISGGTIRGALEGNRRHLRFRRDACGTHVSKRAARAFMPAGRSSSRSIDATGFVGCAWYGIKEDAGAVPVVTDCAFERNTSDYYDTALTAVAAEDIDLLEPGANHGNRSAGGTP